VRTRRLPNAHAVYFPYLLVFFPRSRHLVVSDRYSIVSSRSTMTICHTIAPRPVVFSGGGTGIFKISRIFVSVAAPSLFSVLSHSGSCHDSKVVGTISLRWVGPHAASVAGGLAGNRFHGSNSAIRWMG
jgi:hypothetical protein